MLVDTSAWIAHQRSPDPVIHGAIRDGLLRSHGIVVGELSLGCGEIPQRLAAAARAAGCLPGIDDVSVRAFALRHGFPCRGLGWSDVCLLAAAAAFRGAVLIHTRDRAMRAAAQQLGLLLPEAGG